MTQYKFTSKCPVIVTVPMNVTKAADTFVAIINRDDTPRKYNVTQRGKLSPQITVNKSFGAFVPLTRTVVAEILGKEIGLDYSNAMANPAYAEYFARVCDRLFVLNISLACCRECWFLVRTPVMEDDSDQVEYFYGLTHLAEQEPNGIKPQ